MPELPEVETVRRGMEPAMLGRLIQDVEIRRFDLRGKVPRDFRKKIAGRRVEALVRRGKYIVAMLEGGEGFGLHLGMSGRVKIHGAAEVYDYATHDHVIFIMDNKTRIIFNDPRRFGMIFPTAKKWEIEKPFSVMGPEPLGDDFTAALLAEKLANKNVPIKNALLDQGLVAGIGNIYASEALFHSGIDPRVKTKDVPRKKIAPLVRAIRDVLERAIEAGGSTLRDHKQTDGSTGYFQHSFSVYDREGQACPGCDCDIRRTGGISRIVQSGRSTFYCPRKQK